MHLKNKHPELQAVFQQALFTAALKELNLDLASELPKNITGPRSPVYSLPIIEEAQICGHGGCSSIFVKERSVRGHHHKQHKGVPLPSHWWVCKAQRLKAQGTGPLRVFWEVAVETVRLRDEGPSRRLLHQLMHELEEELEGPQARTQVPRDPRLVSLWLLFTGWPAYVDSLELSNEAVCGLASLPKSRELGHRRLAAAVDTYFHEAVSLLDTMDELVLKRLNSPDPVLK